MRKSLLLNSLLDGEVYGEVYDSSLGYKTPMEFMSEWKNKSTNGAGVSE
jgi:hypothetical protein